MALTFAYGSNMDFGQMRERCPSAQFVCIAILKEHRLAFTRRSGKRECGVADAIPDSTQRVWGVVYRISDADLLRLDKREGLQVNAYVRQPVTVFQDGNDAHPLPVEIYFAVREPNPPLPNQEYKDLIVNGAKFWNLPADYIAELEKIKVAP